MRMLKDVMNGIIAGMMAIILTVVLFILSINILTVLRIAFDWTVVIFIFSLLGSILGAVFGLEVKIFK